MSYSPVFSLSKMRTMATTASQYGMTFMAKSTTKIAHRPLYFLCICALLVSCAPNGFEKNYRSLSAGQAQNLQTCTTPALKIIPAEHNMQDEQQKNLSHYILVGQAQWTSSTQENATAALAQGQKVGACLVLWQKKPVGVVHSTVREIKMSPFQSRFIGPNYNDLILQESFNYIEKPISETYFRYTALFFNRTQKK